MKTLILGGGISGLTAAWYLKQRDPKAQITLLEKEGRLGGCIETARENGFLFEKGPRTFQAGRCPALLELIRDVGLESELIFSDKAASKRFLWNEGKLRSLGSFLPKMIPFLVREFFIAKSTLDDESIYDFASRRFSPKIADELFDPMALGIYAGDIRKLSLRSCFPSFFEWERTHGSLVRGMFCSKRKKKGLFTLQGGMERLIQAMTDQLDIEVVTNCAVESLGTEIIAGNKSWRADQIIAALPASAIGRLTGESFVTKSLWVVNLTYSNSVLAKRGFGYLVPTKEYESLLGMIFDSSLFPTQNNGQGTRLTAMVRSEDPEPLQTALDATFSHLNISQDPVHTAVHLARESIPQFEVGYWKKIAAFEKKHAKNFVLLGNYLEGPSVEACVQRAKKLMAL